MTDDTLRRLLCVRCRNITTGTHEEIVKLTCCPECGSLGSPADLDNTITPTITVHELRILTIWASNWENQMRRTGQAVEDRSAIAGICSGLAQYTDAPLLLSQEIADLRATFGNVTVIDADEERP